MPNADESEDIQEMRKELMEMELDELKTGPLAEIKEEQPDVDLPSGGKEEIMAWVIEWAKAREAKEEEEEAKGEVGRGGEETRGGREEARRGRDAREEARLLIIEPHKGAPEQLYPFMQANPSALPSFVKYIVTDPTHAAWLGEAVKAAPALAGLTDADGQHAFALAHWDCKQACGMPTTDEDALRAIRAASTALQEWWPEGESPRSWKGVHWSGDRVQVLDLMNSGLEVLAPQIGQLTALTNLILYGCDQLKELPPQIGQLTALALLDLSRCPLKELPPQIGQLTALIYLVLASCKQLKELPPQIGQLLALAVLYLDECDQLTLAPGAEEGQPAPTIVAAYARHLIVAPRKDAPGELLAFLRSNPLWVPAFFRTILTDAMHAAWLGEAVTATPELAKLTAADGRRAIDFAVPACKQAMQAALFLLGRFDVDDGKLLHRSATAAVAAATDHGDPEAKPVPRVALKVMREVDQVRAELEGRAGLDPKYVIAIKAVYAEEEAVDAGAWETVKSAAAGLEGVELQRVPDLSRSIQAHLFPSKQEMDQAPADAAPGARRELKRGLSAHTLDASSEYKLLIVLELADRNLKHTIDHEHIAGKDWPAIRHVASHLGRALDHVHAEGGIHADLKPLNTVGDGYTWKLIDFDVFCKVGEPFGNKIPSSGYCPPEMAKVLLAATDQDTAEVDTSLLQEYVASEAYDLWSFGVVLYHLCFSTPLWKTDINDNVDLEGLKLLASVSDPRLRKALDKALSNGVKTRASNELKAATALLRKLLEPDPSKRLGYFKRLHNTPMDVVLEEPFFLGQSLDGATMEQMRQQMTKQHELLGQQMKEQHEEQHELLKKMDGKLDQVLEKLNANFKMLSTLLKGVDSVAPKLICFLPVSAVREDSANKNQWWRTVLSPKDWLNQRVLVFFFDPIQLKLAATNPDAEGKGQGFEITFPKAWVVKAMPYVKLGLAVLKAAAIAGRLSGFPVPDIAGVIGGWMGEQLKALDGLQEEAVESLSRQTADPKLARTELNKVDDYAANLASSALENVAPMSGEPLNKRVAEPLQKSVEELNELLPPGWQQKSGLEFTTATDGTSEWVRPEDVERFKRDGAALLGKEAQVNEGAISQLGAMHQQLTESQAAQNEAEAARDEAQAEKSKADAARYEAEAAHHAAHDEAKVEIKKLKQELIDAKAKAGCKSCCVLS